MENKKMHNIATSNQKLLSFFASKNPKLVLLKLLPIILLFLIHGTTEGFEITKSILFFIIGITTWSFYEYITHRWLYHINFKNKKLKWFFETFHLYHHKTPKDYRVLNAGFLLIYPLAFLFWIFFFVLTQDAQSSTWICLGFLSYYYFYENVHYYIHYKEYKKGYFQKMQKFHLFHHHKNWKKNFGNTTVLWDYIFCTYDKNYKNLTLTRQQKDTFIKK